MVPGPVQAAAVVALDDDAHVAEQRERYRRAWTAWPRSCGAPGSTPPAGRRLLPLGAGAGVGRCPGAVEGRAGAWVLTDALAEAAGMLVSPGEFYGRGGRRLRPHRRGPTRRPHRAASSARLAESSDHPHLGRAVGTLDGRRPGANGAGR